MFVLLWVVNVAAYEVWMGTHLAKSSMATDLASWSMSASQLQGFNVNRAPNDTDPASNTEYRTIFAQFTNAQSVMTEFARSQATRDPDKTDELAFPSIAERLNEIFSIESSFGYNLTIIMFYDERGTFEGEEYLYEWTEIEVQYMRDWLDANGQADVELMWNVRNNSIRNQQMSANSLVDCIEIEASTTALLDNTNNQITFFEWFWNNPVTANKRVALQIPRVLPGDPLTQYEGTRRVAQMLGGIIGYGENGMRSDRLIFLPVTYNDNYPYIPETVASGTQYTDTLTSICLSLIEQRDLFEGRLAALPTVADADSMVRTLPPAISAVANRVMSENTPTDAIPFTVDDADTPLTSLTVTATSSNTNLVNSAGIFLGGSGADRTLALTPAPGQMGVTEITLRVSDGMWFDSATFTLTVGNVLVSEATDTGIKEDLVLENQTSNTAILGTGGSSPWVDRCTVYVFELPDLGAIANPFKSASLSFNYISKDGTLKNNDLYGLGRRSAATVPGSDYYGQTSTSDPTDATLLQAGILTDNTPFGLVETSINGSDALANYLNAQYASGAGIGEHVFLRLNTAGPKSGINRATLTMSEGGSALPTDTRPRIVFTGNSAPTISAVADVGTAQDTSTDTIAFTVGDVDSGAASLSVTATSSDEAIVPNADIVLGGSGADRTVTITPAIGQTGTSLITLQVSDGTRTASTSFTLTVFRALFALPGDAEVQYTLSSPPYAIQGLTSASLLIGTAGGSVGKERCPVFPFQLPELGIIDNPFTSVAFTANYEIKENDPTGNVQVYGLASRDEATVLPND